MTLKLIKYWKSKWEEKLQAEYEEREKLWAEHLEKYGREKECPVCHSPIFYVLPSLWDMTKEDSSLFIPCLNGCGGLIIKNKEGKLEEEFMPTPLQKMDNDTDERILP